jgi:hypothetical protein
MASKTHKSAKYKTVKKKRSVKRVVEKINPEEKHEPGYEAEAEGGPERQVCDPQNNTRENKNERNEEHFHKLKGKYKRHQRIEESALNHVNYHSRGGKSSRVTGTTARRKKSQF